MKTPNYMYRFIKDKVLSLFTALFAVFLFLVGIPASSQTTMTQDESSHALGAILLPEAEYNRLPAANWTMLRANAPRQSMLNNAESSIMLPSPPVGDQASQGSCVAWAVGYAAASMLAYPYYNNWEEAMRSPAFIYNQLKTSTDCSGGMYINTALNLTKSQGVCSWQLMPYIKTRCSTLPDNTQKLDAEMHKVTDWARLNSVSNVEEMKEAVRLGYPVVVGFSVYRSSFDYMWRYNGGIWDTNDLSGGKRGEHACCIVGYDDSRQMFKVQNSWGTNGGDRGFFWVTYDLVRNRIFNQCYVLYGMNVAYIQGVENASCGSEVTYTLRNYTPQGATVTWSASNANLVKVSETSTTAKFRASRRGYCNVMAKVVKNGAVVYLKMNDVWVDCNGTTSPRLSVPGEFTNYYPVSPAVIESNGLLVMEDIFGMTYGSNLLLVSYRMHPDSDPGEEVDPEVIIEGNKVYVYGRITSFTIQRTSYLGRSASVTYEVNAPKLWYSELPPRPTYPVFTVYPNPATDYFSISSAHNFDEPVLLKSDNGNNNKYEVRLVNMQGTIVRTLKACDMSSVEISLQALQPGMYYVHILQDGEVVQREKLIKK